MRDLEEAVLRALDFSLQCASPVPFLERYLRIFNIDLGRDDASKYLRKLARNYCKFMQRDSRFLDFRPSQIASAALLFAINIT